MNQQQRINLTKNKLNINLLLKTKTTEKMY